MKKASQRITKKAVENEIRNLEQRMKTVEHHTGAQISINKEAILSNPNRAKTLEQLKNMSWSGFKEGKSVNKNFINMTVEGKEWKTGQGLMTVQTEIQGKDAVELLQAAAKRESITGE